MRNDFLEARQRQEIHWTVEEEEVLYREFAYCPANADHQHEVDLYEVSTGIVGKCTCCGRIFRVADTVDIAYAATGTEVIQPQAQ